VDALDNDTILMVFGDHGMTKSGDHGGDSEDEIHAGLFVYSPQKLFSRSQAATEHVVSQTDIVPTLSLLLGLPIPFSNLGIVIPSLFETPGVKTILENTSKLHALQLNARQVNRYITEYTQLSNDISSNALEEITNPLFNRNGGFSGNTTQSSNRTISDDEISQKENACLTYLEKIRELCRSVWAKFDVPVIETGIFVTAASCVVSLVWILFSELILHQSNSRKLYKYGTLAALVVFILGCMSFYGYLLVFLSCGLAGLCALSLFTRIGLVWILDLFSYVHFKSVMIVFLLCIQIAGLFSNSYVVNEDRILLFFLQTVVVLSAAVILTNSVAALKVSELENTNVRFRTHKQKDKKKGGLYWSVLKEKRHELVCLFLTMVLLRTSPLFWRCREEQGSCDSTELFSTSKQNDYQLWSGSVFFILVPASLIFHLRTSGNLNGYSSPVLAVKYALPFGAVFASLHWLLQRVPAKTVEQNSAIGFIQQILAPCILYCCCLGTLCCILYQPITAFVLRPRDLEDERTISTGQQSMRNAVVKIFKRLRSELSTAERNEDIPHVYGLGTVYSSAVLILLVCFGLPVALVLGDGLGPSMTLMMVQIYLFLEFDRMVTSHEAVDARMTLGMYILSFSWNDSHWASRKKNSELIKISRINKVSLV
jgi:phosphatidylinositol glycan class O